MPGTSQGPEAALANTPFPCAPSQDHRKVPCHMGTESWRNAHRFRGSGLLFAVRSGDGTLLRQNETAFRQFSLSGSLSAGFACGRDRKPGLQVDTAIPARRQPWRRVAAAGTRPMPGASDPGVSCWERAAFAMARPGSVIVVGWRVRPWWRSEHLGTIEPDDVGDQNFGIHRTEPLVAGHGGD